MPFLGQSDLNYRNGRPVAKLFGDANQFYLDLAHIGHAWIGMHEISLNGTNLDELLPFIWGRVLSLFLELNGVIVLHSCVSKVGDRAVIFCGPKGVGKSTLAYNLSGAGYPCLSDDLAPIMSNGMVLPGMPSWKLWPASITGDISTYDKVHKELEKRIVPGNFWRDPLEVGSIIFLNPFADNISLEPLPAGSGLMQLVTNSFQAEMIQGWPLQVNRLNRLADFSERIPVYGLNFTRGLENLPELIHYLEDNHFGMGY